MKDNLADFIIIGIISIFVGVSVAGLAVLVVHQQSKFAKESRAQCAKVAQLSSVKSYNYDNYNCYLAKDGKIVKVKL